MVRTVYKGSVSPALPRGGNKEAAEGGRRASRPGVTALPPEPKEAAIPQARTQHEGRRNEIFFTAGKSQQRRAVRSSQVG